MRQTQTGAPSSSHTNMDPAKNRGPKNGARSKQTPFQPQNKICLGCHCSKLMAQTSKKDISWHHKSTSTVFFWGGRHDIVFPYHFFIFFLKGGLCAPRMDISKPQFCRDTWGLCNSPLGHQSVETLNVVFCLLLLYRFI